MLQFKDIKPGQIFFVPAEDESLGGKVFYRDILGKLFMLSIAAVSELDPQKENDGIIGYGSEVVFDDYGGEISLRPDTEVQLVEPGWV